MPTRTEPTIAVELTASQWQTVCTALAGYADAHDAAAAKSATAAADARRFGLTDDARLHRRASKTHHDAAADGRELARRICEPAIRAPQGLGDQVRSPPRAKRTVNV